ncbi:hypothetical protein HRR80_008808 [Exophiala dermatitidis]|uniref:Uncharacterized protein n=1 Tax=Exophiala dermatitidis TaxID=5970 RepID=A0AAN6EKW6_EXODE|nr:hypothetical protein HRR73_009041 [Exophiala dermatitidis]KAJ4540226.1 hypothetical protein HRR76_003639 [Exophiala dermatitidis]KAJ4565163.1 hypothetical protein HRR82_008998 [Exophiala dermatitidis]KAJ4589568.1 hypothetical protein HRR84_007837 [Exophiala dermatitidis]KAJ4612453.1 hypothetical protein HRR86_008908 [Exophiala dermatitidis]
MAVCHTYNLLGIEVAAVDNHCMILGMWSISGRSQQDEASHRRPPHYRETQSLNHHSVPWLHNPRLEAEAFGVADRKCMSDIFKRNIWQMQLPVAWSRTTRELRTLDTILNDDEY